MTRFANFYAYDTAEETPPEVILLHGGQTGAHTSFVRKYSATFADINLEAQFKNVQYSKKFSWINRYWVQRIFKAKNKFCTRIALLLFENYKKFDYFGSLRQNILFS